jgi:hypothetical protein
MVLRKNFFAAGFCLCLTAACTSIPVKADLIEVNDFFVGKGQVTNLDPVPRPVTVQSTVGIFFQVDGLSLTLAVPTKETFMVEPSETVGVANYYFRIAVVPDLFPNLNYDLFWLLASVSPDGQGGPLPDGLQLASASVFGPASGKEYVASHSTQQFG